uniref:Uncharacterized protein n=1 Tax=Wuchereria bancrofti TaxID=6293 RepID=A0AAF5PH25_WUCBA
MLSESFRASLGYLQFVAFSEIEVTSDGAPSVLSRHFQEAANYFNTITKCALIVFGFLILIYFVEFSVFFLLQPCKHK